MNSQKKRKIWFVRHAQSEYNRQHLFTGWHDPQLTEKGMAAAMNLKTEFSDIAFDHVFSSPLQRASTTAISIIGDSIDIKYDDRLKERSYGDWSGLNKTDVRDKVGDEVFLSARRGWDTSPPNGESLKDVSLRVTSFINSLPVTGNILVVSHGNTIRAISVILGINTKEEVSSYEIRTGTFLLIE